MKLTTIVSQLMDDLSSCATIGDVEAVEITYVGRNGIINELLTGMKTLSPEEKKIRGKEINTLKKEVTTLIEQKKELLYGSVSDDSSFDVTLPGKKHRLGSRHPHTIMRRDMNKIFHYLGFSMYEGPHIETDEYVFERANLPKNHPARSLQDTILIQDPDILLRSHTSSVENRALENESLPLRIVAPGITFRYETPSQTNHFLFYQYQGVAVARDITMADLKGTFNLVFKHIMGKNTVLRFRAKYYPEVEPGCGIDIRCTFCHGAGCSSCKYRGWVEMGGAGMIHPHMLGAAGIDVGMYTGFAFGLGFDRMVMQKMQIDDIRKIYNGSLI